MRDFSIDFMFDTLMSDPVVQAAQDAFKQRLRNNNDVSDNTRNAQAIAKAWRSAVYAIDPDRFQIEAIVAPDLDQKIDILDTETHTAYEFKVSGKNATSEFYKDVVKVIVWNQKRKKNLTRLVFITEEGEGRRYLDTPMPRAYIEYLATHGLEITVAYIRHS
ncbi:MAG: hypothetical protein A2061_05515 [Gallionellales bacterium GWA2_59_43]|nr:MAG: hypothetical protein A2061_05515 [Gallionellales bacterium GWA2_59_43]